VRKEGVMLEWVVLRERGERIVERMAEVRGKKDVAGRHSCSDR
jgi:hypothetical protein